MKNATFIAAAFLCFLLESNLSVFGIRPDLTALLACYVGLKSGPRQGLIKGAFLGVVEDGLAGRMLGPDLLGTAMAGFLAGYLSGPMGLKPATGHIGIFLFTAIGGAISIGSLSAFGEAPVSAAAASYIILTQSLLNSLSTPFIRTDENRYRR